APLTYPLSLHDALPISTLRSPLFGWSDEQIFRSHRNYLQADNPAFVLLKELHEARHHHSIAGFVEYVFARTHLCQAFFVLDPTSVANLLKALELARQVEGAGIRSLRGFVRT